MDLMEDSRMAGAWNCSRGRLLDSNTILGDNTAARLAARASQSLSLQDDLRDELMTDYRPDIAPLDDLPIRLTYNLIKIVNMDERGEKVSLGVNVVVNWQDDRLRWEPRLYNEIDYISMDMKKIWFPHIVHYDSVEIKHKFFDNDEKIQVSFEGLVGWTGVMVFTSPCQMDVENFPMDVQKCRQLFRIGTQPSEKRLLGYVRSDDPLFMELHDSDYYPHSSWFVNVTKYIRVIEPATPFDVDAVFEITMHRKHQYYTMRILAPILLLSILVMFVFFIPPDAGEKISLGVTLLLTFSVFQMTIDHDLPATSNSTPHVTTAMILLQFCSALSIVSSVMVLNFHHLGPEFGGRMPAFLRVIFFSILAKLTCHSRVVGRMVKSERKESMSLGTFSNKSFVDNGRKPSVNAELPDGGSTQIQISNSELWKIESKMDEILEVLNKLKEGSDVEENEWKVAALILDRILMYTCLFTMLAIYINFMVTIAIS